jgi:hypothetical protein
VVVLASGGRRYLDWRFSFYQLLHYHLRRDLRCSEEGSGTLEQENISDMKACGESEEKKKSRLRW